MKFVQRDQFNLQVLTFVGLKYNLSKASNIEIVHNIGLGENGITLK
jgi:hypothetical protein